MADDYYVYVHTNKSNGKKYFGITNNISTRWGHNGNQYIDSSCRAFGNAVKKYGWDGFTHEILHSHISRDEACRLEKYYISEFKTNIYRHGNKYGYNLTDGGEGGGSYDRTGEHNPFYGKNHTEETKQKLSDAKIGRYSGKESHTYNVPLSSETREALSRSLKEYYTTHECSHKKPVYCITDDLWFGSVNEASDYYNITIGLISNCCAGNALSTHGKQFTHNLDGTLPEYHSRYFRQKNNEEKALPNAVPVICVETGKQYSTAIIAARDVGLKCSNGILKSCRNNKSASGGYHWRFA